MTESPTHTDGLIIEDDAHQPRLNEMSKKFIEECAAEKERLGDDFPLAAKLIDEAIDRVQTTGRIPGRELYADVFKQKLIKVSQKVFVPTKEFPKFNFNGKLLGPKGNSLRTLQEETLCRILIKGRHSMRDSAKEEELRQSGDPRHAHLNKNLYYEIQTIAPPAEAHARVAYALAEIRKYLIPDSNDEVSQSQRMEILADPELAKKAKLHGEKPVGRQQYGGQTFNRSGMSILKKITGFNDQSHEEQDLEIAYEQERPMMKRSQQSSEFYQRRKSSDGDRFQSGRKPVMSILQKITGQNYADDQEEEEYERGNTYQTGYHDEDQGQNHNNFSQMRPNMSSQRHPIKRRSQDALFQGRYENPEKRGTPFYQTPTKTSRISFTQNY